jgi:hypothetical protein
MSTPRRQPNLTGLHDFPLPSNYFAQQVFPEKNRSPNLAVSSVEMYRFANFHNNYVRIMKKGLFSLTPKKNQINELVISESVVRYPLGD